MEVIEQKKKKGKIRRILSKL